MNAYEVAWEMARLIPRIQSLGSDLSYPRSHYSDCPRRYGAEDCDCDEGWDEEFEEEAILLQRLEKRREYLQGFLAVDPDSKWYLDVALVQLNRRKQFTDAWGKFRDNEYQKFHHERFYEARSRKFPGWYFGKYHTSKTPSRFSMWSRSKT
jgi:hypothetical protein